MIIMIKIIIIRKKLRRIIGVKVEMIITVIKTMRMMMKLKENMKEY